ncbi:MAG: carboxyl-terminal protease, partial [Spirochaetales bacterium]|nr:carboxyl-terminal protease [Spirochaetales bacterium]
MKKFNIFITLLLTSLSLIFAQPRAEQVTPLDINVQNNFSSTNTQSILNSSDITSSLIEINNIYRYIDANFLYEVDPDKVKEGLASGLMNSLGDEYSYYISKEDSQEYAEDTSGTYVGIGTYLTKMNPSYTDYKDPKTYMVQIVSPFPGGPADRAGIRANDLISHVNGQD